MSSTERYMIVQIEDGISSIRSQRDGETFHPVTGPESEPANLYVNQLRLPERVTAHSGSFVIWDVGLGAAANPIAFLRAAQQIPASVIILSFDSTLEPLRFALSHPNDLTYLSGFTDQLAALAEAGIASFKLQPLKVEWVLKLGDFPTLLSAPEAESIPPPNAILFDPFSPAKNPSMWTLDVLAKLHAKTDPAIPCSLASYTRSTVVRVSLLLAGFFVGVGLATGEKDETTVAANTLSLIQEPLDRRWLSRVRRSTSAEPLQGATYRQARLSPENWEKLTAHPQFQ